MSCIRTIMGNQVVIDEDKQNALEDNASTCKGNACDVVKIRWNPTKKGYDIKNTSDREVKVKLQVIVQVPWCAHFETYYVDANSSEFAAYPGYCELNATYA